MASGVTGSLDPNLRLGDRRQGRYPSPFFDISQQYMPPTLKELFKWCYFYATTNSFVGPALNKIARYPVTDLVFESSQKDVSRQYEEIFNRHFQIKSFLMETNLDLCTYGNGFVTLYYPFTRFVGCRRCGKKEPFKTARIEIKTDLKVRLKCKKCGSVGEAKIEDRVFRSRERVKLLRLNPQQIDIKFNEVSGDHQYLYSIPDKLKRQIKSGDKSIFETTPLVYLESIKKKRKIKLNSQNVFHLKRPSVAGKDSGWGVPLIMYVLKDLYYFYNLRRGQEAIVNEFITPLDVISPAPSGQADPYRHANLSTFRKSIESQIEKHRRDPNYKAVVPFPIQYQRIGGDGKAMLIQGELDFLAKSIIGGMGIPQEFVYGGLTWSGSSVSLRTLENEFMHHRTQLLNMSYWIKDRVRVYLGLPDLEEMRFLDFKMADDVQRLAQVTNLEQNGKVSTSTLLTELGYDFETEQNKRRKEADLLAKVNHQINQRAMQSQNKMNESSMREQSRLTKIQNEMMSQDAGMGSQQIDPNNPDQNFTEQGAMGGQPGGMPQQQGGMPQQGAQAGQGGQQQGNIIDFASAQQQQNIQPQELSSPAYTNQQLIQTLAQQYMQLDENGRGQLLQDLQQKNPELAQMVVNFIEQAYGKSEAPGGATANDKNKGAAPPPNGENKMPRGQGAV